MVVRRLDFRSRILREERWEIFWEVLSIELHETGEGEG